jgi:hypothetical protein
MIERVLGALEVQRSRAAYGSDAHVLLALRTELRRERKEEPDANAWVLQVGAACHHS